MGNIFSILLLNKAWLFRKALAHGINLQSTMCTANSQQVSILDALNNMPSWPQQSQLWYNEVLAFMYQTGGKFWLFVHLVSQDHFVSDPPQVFMFASTFRWFQNYRVRVHLNSEFNRYCFYALLGCCNVMCVSHHRHDIFLLIKR